MKFISWNVNGLRAVEKKSPSFSEIVTDLNADFFCIQETKLQAGQSPIDLAEYHEYWNYAEKKGYSGTAIFTKSEPLSVSYGINLADFDNEGRVITLEYPDFYLINVYTPNAQRELTRLDYRMAWEDAFKNYLLTLKAQKHVILCGDLNVAHQNIDLKNWKTNQKNAGFTPEERNKFSVLLEAGFIDTFRYLHPNLEEAYSWWSYRFNARANNAGWRIDYWLVDNDFSDKIQNAEILADVFGSDHCPVLLELNI